jgi:hypothetical protein
MGMVPPYMNEVIFPTGQTGTDYPFALPTIDTPENTRKKAKTFDHSTKKTFST